ncbi:DsbA family oxidoreductase [Paracoccus salsus]|uniref:DsbA family oxidoreductase n=1 Tax=Paracoccus salsus TaxID=2911061 RepID=UPI001F35AF75|nr:DsbA family oxidoreductase [Paracoccus salsus]MCF3973915.1 DsbA family oxidoreductase [Paracoccus salsus]
MIRLDIFADPVCPWCLIGKLELDRALESRPSHPFNVTWHPFRLNPDMPPEGMDRLAYLKAKPGAAEAARTLAQRAAAMGLVLDPAPRQPDTTDAHRLMYWAGLEGAQTPVMSGLLRAHWQEARDIADTEQLARIAGAAGLDEALVSRLLRSDADRDQIIAREMHARERGINAVPTFIVADQHAISGAQTARIWQDIIDELTQADSV